MNVRDVGLPKDMTPLEKIRAKMSMGEFQMGGGNNTILTPEQIHAIFKNPDTVIQEGPRAGGKQKRTRRKGCNRRKTRRN